ncbi:MAG: AbrB/MazE/SpoVT family DNA-binding domain-containing protein [Verrucomicrobiia bacterium]
MKQVSIPIDQAGRVVLPKGVRRELAIKPGEMLRVSVHGASVTLTPDRDARGLVRKGMALVFSVGGGEVLSNETVGRIGDELREGRQAESVPGLEERKRRA